MERVPAICVADPPPDLIDVVAEAVGVSPSYAPLEAVLAPQHRDKLDRLSVAFVVLGGGDDEVSVLASCADLVGAGVPVVLLASDPDRVARAALRADVSDVISPDSGVDEFRQAFSRAETDRVPDVAPVPAAPPVAAVSARPGLVGVDGAPVLRKTVAVVSPKGGVGKTMIATNLALGLAKIAPEQTVLVDLDVFFGDVTTALNMAPDYTLPDMVQSVAANDQVALKSILARHDSGLYVVGTHDSATSAAAAGVDGDMALQLLRMLQQTFHFVVVDTAPGLTQHTLAALDACNELVLVSQMEVSGVRGLRKVTEALTALRLIPGSLHVVVNESDPGRGLSVDDVEANISRKVDVEIPVSKRVPLSLNQGIPLMVDPGRDGAVRALTDLVERVAGVPMPGVEKPKSLFDKIKGGV